MVRKLFMLAALLAVPLHAATHYVAANGSNSNDGLSEAPGHPWQFAPGMPACSANCAAYTPSAGDSIILRGGDTWHAGNSSASPYTGGSWRMDNWAGGACDYYTGTSGCIYWGVDKTWYSGSSWTRPVITGDNPTSTSLVSSCPYQTPGNGNNLAAIYNSAYIDNIEFTGLCAADPNGNGSIALQYSGTGNVIETNLYIHGWTATTTAGSSTNSIPCTLLGGSTQGTSTQTMIGNVIDGSDSNAGACAWGLFPNFTHFAYNYVGHTTQGVGDACHDIHDNIFEYFSNPDLPTHGNILECNDEAATGSPNAFYGNIMRHINSNFFSSGQVGWWFCPNATADYWFNNIAYDTGGLGDGNAWAVAGTTQYPGCVGGGPPGNSSVAGQFMFNNSFSGFIQVCHMQGSNVSGGAYTHISNEHLMNTPFDGGGCSVSNNVAQTWAQSDAQGYTSGSAGVTDTDTCANDPARPCSPNSASDSTVNAGANNQSYCAVLAAASDPAISTLAAAACRGSISSVSYNSTTHTVSYPGFTVTPRPTSGAWDSGAWQYTSSGGGSPIASVAPSTLPFGNQVVSTTGGPQTVTLSNTGSASLVISSIVSSSSQFTKTVDQCQTSFGYSLPQGMSCTVTLTFTPNALGPQTGILTFTYSNNSGPAQQTVALTGTGISAGLWTSASSVPNFTVSWSSAGTTQTCTATKTLTISQPAVLIWWGWLSGSAGPTFNAVSGDALANVSAAFNPGQVGPAGGKYMFSGAAYEASAAGGSTTGSVTLNTTSATGNFDCDLIQPVIGSGSAILDSATTVGYPNCSPTACAAPSPTLSGNDYVLVWGAKGNPAPIAPGSPWTTPADIDSTNQFGGVFGALNQSTFSGFNFGPVSGSDYESVSALSLGQAETLTVGVSPVGSGTLSCTSGTYANGTAINCVLTPATGYAPSSWSGATGCSGTTCNFKVNGTTNVTAVLTAVTYPLTLVTSPMGIGGFAATGGCIAGQISAGASITCTANSAAGYNAPTLSGNGCSPNPCGPFTMNGPATITATYTPTGGGSFTWTPTYVGNVHLTGTLCDPASTQTSGTTIGACTCSAGTGWTCSSCSSPFGTGVACSGAGVSSFSITANSGATITGTQNSYTLGTTTSGTGSGTATPSATSLHYGDSYTITVTPAAGSVVTSVSNCGVSPTSPYTGTMPAASCNVQVVFTLESFAWTPTVNPPGSGAIGGTNSAGGSYQYNTPIGLLTPNPALGFQFSNWTAVSGSAACSGTTVPCPSFDLTAISAATANFIPNNYIISISIPGGGGTVSGCAGSHAYQSTYLCTANPAPGFILQSISGCGGSGGTTYSGATPATNCNILGTFAPVSTSGASPQLLETQ